MEFLQATSLLPSPPDPRSMQTLTADKLLLVLGWCGRGQERRGIDRLFPDADPVIVKSRDTFKCHLRQMAADAVGVALRAILNCMALMTLLADAFVGERVGRDFRMRIVTGGAAEFTIGFGKAAALHQSRRLKPRQNAGTAIELRRLDRFWKAMTGSAGTELIQCRWPAPGGAEVGTR
jgi:hypothetical protein